MVAFAKGNPGYYTIVDFAMAAGVPYVRLAEFKRKKLIRPMKPGGGRGKPDLYHESQIPQLRRLVEDAQKQAEAEFKMPSGPNEVRYNGDEARMCFEAFAQGKSIRDCVTAFGIHPKIVTAIQKAYYEVDGGIVVSKQTLEAIEKLPLDGPIPITCETELLEVLTLASQESRCKTCKKRPRSYCRACTIQAARDARKQVEETFEKVFAAAQERGLISPPTPPIVVNGTNGVHTQTASILDESDLGDEDP